MGKKKRRRITKDDVFWCFFCDKMCADMDALILHQKQRHFRCGFCGKMLASAGGMVIHVTQVHKQHIRKVPNAVKGRDDFQHNVVGMEGIPPEAFSAKLKELGIKEHAGQNRNTQAGHGVGAAGMGAHMGMGMGMGMGMRVGMPVGVPGMSR